VCIWFGPDSERLILRTRSVRSARMTRLSTGPASSHGPVAALAPHRLVTVIGNWCAGHRLETGFIAAGAGGPDLAVASHRAQVRRPGSARHGDRRALDHGEPHLKPTRLRSKALTASRAALMPPPKKSLGLVECVDYEQLEPRLWVMLVEVSARRRPWLESRPQPSNRSARSVATCMSASVNSSKRCERRQARRLALCGGAPIELDAIDPML